MKPFTGGLTIFDLDEAEWKPWRAVFNKGFHGDRIMSLVPGMVEETKVYAETLKDLAEKGEMCFLDPLTLRFAIDVIGKMILNSSLGSQRGYNPLADGMLGQSRWHNPNAEINPFSQLDFVRKFIHWKNGRQMDLYVGTELDMQSTRLVRIARVRSRSLIWCCKRTFLEVTFPRHRQRSLMQLFERWLSDRCDFSSSQGMTLQQVSSVTASTTCPNIQRFSLAYAQSTTKY